MTNKGVADRLVTLVALAFGSYWGFIAAAVVAGSGFGTALMGTAKTACQPSAWALLPVVSTVVSKGLMIPGTEPTVFPKAMTMLAVLGEEARSK